MRLIFLCVLLNGLIAGSTLDKAVMGLPARRKIGLQPFLSYFRATDLGPGMVFYPLLGLAAPILTIITAVLYQPSKNGLSGETVSDITIAALFAIGHVLSTGGAVSTALRLRTGKFSDEELAIRFNRFASWNGLRVVCLLRMFIFSLLAI